MSGGEQGQPAEGSADGRAPAALLHALHELASAAASAGEPVTVAQIAADHARRLLAADGSEVFLWDPEAEVLQQLARLYSSVSPFTPRAGEGAAGVAFERGAPVVVNDYQTWEHAALHLREAGAVAAVAVPLIVRGHCMGAVGAWTRSHGFTIEHARMLALVAAQVAPLIEAAQLASETEAKERTFRALHEIAVAASGVLDPGALARLTVDRACDLLRVDSAGLAWWDPEKKVLMVLADNHPDAPLGATERRPGEGGMAVAFERKEPVVINDYLNWEHKVDWAAELRHRSVLAVPLMVQDRAVGAIGVRSVSGRKFRAGEVQLLSLLASQVAPALEAARLHTESERRRAEAEALAEVLRSQQAALEHQALHDALTDLPNRVYLYARLQQEVAAARRLGTRCALLIMDLDRFKEINDTFGHHSGDILLQQVGRRLAAALRESDTVARLGGDEFAAVLADVGERSAAGIVARKLLRALDDPFAVEDSVFTIGGSLGIALYPDDGTDADILMRRADAAMYAAKRAARGVAYYAHHGPRRGPRQAFAGDLRQAIEGDQLVLHYQPELFLKTGQVACVEALVRWRRPDHGLVHPERFVPLAEQTGLIKPLDRWVLTDALTQAGAWRRNGLHLDVGVNLSVRNLLDPQLPELIAALLRAHGVAATCLKLELTESSLMGDRRRAVDVLTRLKAMGIRLAIDDFGSGYSSLAYLKRLPVDEVKIDKSFVMDMSSEQTGALIVRATIELAHNLGLQVAAEGVLDKVTFDMLAVQNCDFVQGRFLCRPLPTDRLLRWLSGQAQGSVCGLPGAALGTRNG